MAVVSSLMTIKQAAARVRRSRSRIEAWISEGLLDVTVVKEGDRVVRRFVDEEQLLGVLRSKILSNPKRRRSPDDRTPL